MTAPRPEAVELALVLDKHGPVFLATNACVALIDAALTAAEERGAATRPASRVETAAKAVVDSYVRIETEAGPAWATPDADTHWALVKKGGHLDLLHAALAPEGEEG